MQKEIAAKIQTALLKSLQVFTLCGDMKTREKATVSCLQKSLNVPPTGEKVFTYKGSHLMVLFVAQSGKETPLIKVMSDEGVVALVDPTYDME